MALRPHSAGQDRRQMHTTPSRIKMPWAAVTYSTIKPALGYVLGLRIRVMMEIVVNKMETTIYLADQDSLNYRTSGMLQRSLFA